MWQITRGAVISDTPKDVVYKQAKTSDVLKAVRVLMQDNEATYHLFGFGQYHRGTTRLDKAIAQLKWWAGFCAVKGIEPTAEIDEAYIDFCKNGVGATKGYYSKGGNHIASLVKNY